MSLPFLLAIGSSEQEEIQGLLAKAKEGDRPSLIELLTHHKYDPATSQNEKNETILHLACRNGHLDIVRTLIEVYQCNVDIRNYSSYIAQDHFKIVAYFCAKFLSSNAKEMNNLLTAACKMGFLPIAKLIFCSILMHNNKTKLFLKDTIYQDNPLILMSCCNSKQFRLDKSWDITTPLKSACYYGYLDVIKFFLKEAQLHLPFKLINNITLSSLIEIAFKRGHHKIFDYLFSTNRSISVANPQGIFDLYAHEAREAEISTAMATLSAWNNALRTQPSFLSFMFFAVKRADRQFFEHMVQSNYCTADFKSQIDSNGDTLLHAACISCDLDMVKEVFGIVSNGNLPVKNEQGNTCLHLACEWGSLAIVKFLVEKGFGVNEKNSVGETALHICIRFKRWCIFEYLLNECKSTIDINSTTNDGETLLHLATYHPGYRQFSKTILEFTSFGSIAACDKYGESPLFNACRMRDLDMIILLTTKGCDVLAKNIAQETVFHITCRLAATDVMDLIFEVLEKYPQNLCNFSGQTLLHIACRASIQMVKYLAKQQKYDMDEDINLADKIDGLTPLQYACMEKQDDLFKLLINHPDCDPERTDTDGNNALHICCKQNLESMAKSCLEHCPVDAVNQNGSTALHMACVAGHYKLALSLLQELHRQRKGSRISFPCNRDGSTLLHIAAAANDDTVVFMKYVIETRTCDHQAKDKNGETALFAAIRGKVLPNIEYLCSLQYDNDHWYNNSNKSPLSDVFIENLSFIVPVISSIPLSILENYVAKISLHINDTICEGVDVSICQYMLYTAVHPISSHQRVHNNCSETRCKLTNDFINNISELYPSLICMKDSQGFCLLHYFALYNCMYMNTDLYDKVNICASNISSDLPTPLHFACFVGNEYFIFNSLQGDNASSLLHVKDKRGRTPSDLYGQSYEPCVSYLLARGATMVVQNDRYQIKELFQKQCVSVYVLGHSGVGKTTLIHTLQHMIKGDTLTLRHTPKPTTGIVPYDVLSRKNCFYRFYDFGGHSEFGMSQSLWLESLLSGEDSLHVLPSVFLLLVKATDPFDVNQKQIETWFDFVRKHIRNTSRINVHFALVCSHEDKLDDKSQSQERKCLLEDYFMHISMYPLSKNEKVLILNGLKGNTTPMNKLERYLGRMFSDDEHQYHLSEQCLQLNHYLKKWFPGVPCKVRDLADKVSEMREFTFNTRMEIKVSGSNCYMLLPHQPKNLIKLLNKLHAGSYITLLKQPGDDELEWWIVHEEVQNKLSCELNLIFSPKEFDSAPKLSSVHNTGVIPTEVLAEIFNGLSLPIDLIESYLISLEYCKLIEDEEVLNLITGGCNTIGRNQYFFFPGLVNKAKADFSSNTKYYYSSAWMLDYPKDLGLRFLHSLLLCLAFKFPSSDVDSGSKYERRLVLWTNGLFWHTIQGIDVLVEVMEDRKVIALFRCKTEKQLISLAECRADVIAEVRKVLKRSNVHRVETGSEYYLYPAPSDFKLISYKKNFLFSKMRNCLTKELDERSLFTNDTNTVSLHDLLGFDSYIVLELSTLGALRQLLDTENLDDTLLHKVFNEVQLKLGSEVFARILGVPGNLFEEFKQTHSTAPVLAFCAQLDKYSIFRLHDLPS